jgi:hypothetical protein
LRDAVNAYLEDHELDADKRCDFVKQEITFTDGSAGRRTGEYLLSLI